MPVSKKQFSRRPMGDVRGIIAELDFSIIAIDHIEHSRSSGIIFLE